MDVLTVTEYVYWLFDICLRHGPLDTELRPVKRTTSSPIAPCNARNCGEQIVALCRWFVLIATFQPGTCVVGEQTVLPNNNPNAKIAGDGELKNMLGLIMHHIKCMQCTSGKECHRTKQLQRKFKRASEMSLPLLLNCDIFSPFTDWICLHFYCTYLWFISEKESFRR
jgi:hypothetical protein